MIIALKKGRDGPAALSCRRPDGSRTWARLHPFFPGHDLTHCAVESVLGFTEAFFGLVAAGWELDAFQEPQAAQRMPAEALWAEHIVGLLDVEQGTGRRLSDVELNDALAAGLTGQGVPLCRSITPAELGAIRELRAHLLGQWQALAPGATLELSFPVTLTKTADPP